ncbi:SCO family protein [Pseudobacteriovorax antillogorgiicola]|uniref:Protein SCO1/2 n=1 Tax=Pseudobacteriovorax antillogorgiicola TaxID=1513793 RepID=A0A1Y6CMZ4_9BACT|nr:SCO family protein [Pseudobacteriovorax antillogorgiicola]TCS44435.1 protein SCO1/2 [Pseudobacteriovorax antillogorgiicola]SMF78846.1 protein SCO1/2 [Pseudobacteriovorax antillogorgiicola]
MSKKLGLLLFGMFLGGVSGTSYFLIKQLDSASIENGRKLSESRPLKDFDLTDQNGASFNKNNLLGRWSLVTFGFTNCPDVCPSAMASYRDELKLLEDSMSRLQFIFVTVDPERDSKERLKSYLEYFHPAIIGLTGSQEQIKSFAGMFSVHFQKQGGGENYNMAHSPQFFLVDPQGNWTAMYNPPLSRGKIAVDLTRIASKDSI